MTTGSQD